MVSARSSLDLAAELPEDDASETSSISPASRRSMSRASLSLEDVGVMQGSHHTFKEMAQSYRNAAGSIREIKRQLVSGRSRSFEQLAEQACRTYFNFTPGLLQSLLRQCEDLENAANDFYCKTHVMAVLLVDISGFTKMSVKLGAEATSKYTNKFFGDIMQVIMEHSGDVLKFLGDALLVGWPADISSAQSGHQDIVLAAADCAAAIMQHNNYQIQPDIMLTLHGALAVGRVHAYDVGNSSRREFLIGGSLLADLGHMEAEASSGELVASADFLNLLPRGPEIEEPSGCVAVCAEKLTSPALKRIRWLSRLRKQQQRDTAQELIHKHTSMQYGKLEPDTAEYQAMLDWATATRSFLEAHVPISCRHAMESESLSISVGEMRWITTLFLSVDALIPFLNAGQGAPVQAAFCLIIDAARSNGGEIRQFVLDDKGCVAIIAWGLPRAAHGMPKDAELAVQCAISIMTGLKAMRDESRACREMQPGPHVGIAAGEAYVGLLGSHHRCEYAMVGPAVNLAARLMGKALPWQVLVDEKVYRHMAETTFEFEKRLPVKAKGYDTMIDVFEPLFQVRQLPYLGMPLKLIEHWDELALDFQFAGKVASVMAECPDGGMCDFKLTALISVLEAVGHVSARRSIDAVLNLRAINVLRLTRCSGRSNPSYAFRSKEVHEFLAGLLPIKVTGAVHYHFASWLKKEIDNAESADASDRAAKAAALAMLHHDVDAKLLYHQNLSSVEEPTEIGWLMCTGDFSLNLFSCCTFRSKQV
eukprot:TRINITY_DN38506_c0_g1_i1.p1 TRINITY_DN38506_c0_g1~~TRINITY_DN38506_c0_g1_i1.p1  ORF type:complete len:761 (+),score=119.14 TRINITY_DN38506_c0_g1_i1:100-2382(+)